MSFRITGLDPGPFIPLYGLSDAELAARGARRYAVDNTPGFPDRVRVRDVEVGGTVLLLNYEHLPVDTPYRSAHAIFVEEGALARYDSVQRIPDALRIRPISLRAFSAGGDMLDAELCDGTQLEPVIMRLLSHPEVAYLHAHYARRGCYAARIDRA